MTINDSTSKDHDQHGSSMNQREIGLVGIIAMCHEPNKTRNMFDQDRMHQLALSRSGSMHQVRIRQPRSEWLHQMHMCQSRSLHQMRMGNEHQLSLSRSGQGMAHQLALSRTGHGAPVGSVSVRTGLGAPVRSASVRTGLGAPIDVSVRQGHGASSQP
ncbi:hypothetical protein TanjilG_26641 [Lupinus angustifolius]|uniref:Uncharacterized protein n=1 Tax=Lupinus angustifolius TaxID=3871 RepID=A0A1J7HK32_LUPAN|nr:hypothetical protein TanjilG_26641 [Lupinus angustifolius]